MKTYNFFAFTILFASAQGIDVASAQPVNMIYPASICDTANVNDDNSLNDHIDKSSTLILGIGNGRTDPDYVYCPIPRHKPFSRNGVAVAVYLLRESADYVIDCSLTHRRVNGLAAGSTSFGYNAGEGPTGLIRLVGRIFPTVRGGNLGISCGVEPNNGLTLYTIQVRER